VKRCQLQDGIDLCKRNVSDFLNETETLISQGRPSHALIFAEFAIEELGKILVIKHAFNLDPNDPFKIMGKEFYDHETKSKNAWTVLGPKLRILFDEGVCLPNTVFERGVAVE
jgi:AbiV family abortive infection protein